VNQTEIKDYRKILEKEFMDKDIEIETTLSYISIGALGFFMTINEKFFKIQTSNYKFILIISLLFLFLSFVLILIRKSRSGHHDLILLQHLDSMNQDSEEDDLDLLKLWDNCHKELRTIRIFIYITLATGIGLQILFLVFNYLLF
jgi:hypothetical protein